MSHSFHLTCLKVEEVPNKWVCPLCQKTAAARNEKSKGKQTKEILDEALKLDCMCVNKRKPLLWDKLLKCHKPLCENGHFKRMPNNALTTWKCTGCKSGGNANLNTKEAKEAKDSLHACKSDDDLASINF